MRAFNDLRLDAGQDVSKRLLELPPLIAGIGEQRLQKGIPAEEGGQQQDAAIAILNIGGMNDGVQQQAQGIYENMALLALDLLACVIARRIDAGPPCMGSLLSSSLRATIFLSRFIDRFLCSTWNPVSSPRPAVLQSRRAQEQSRLAVAPDLASCCALARSHLDCFEHDGTGWCALATLAQFQML